MKEIGTGLWEQNQSHLTTDTGGSEANKRVKESVLIPVQREADAGSGRALEPCIKGILGTSLLKGVELRGNPGQGQDYETPGRAELCGACTGPVQCGGLGTLAIISES